MPAPPEIEVSLSQPVFEQVCEDLGLKKAVNVVLKRSASRGSVTRGTAAWDRTITIYYGMEKQEVTRLPFVVSQITRTILHELRHEWQFENWTEKQWEDDARYSYNIKPSEEDARDFAAKNVTKYRALVRVKRTGVSKLGRLSAAEKKVR